MIDLILSLFMLHEPGFIFTSVAVFIAILILTQNSDHNLTATWVIITFAILIEWNNTIEYNWMTIIMYSIGYFAIGAISSVIKWFSYVYQKRDRYIDIKKRWIQQYYNKYPSTSVDIDIDGNTSNQEIKNRISAEDYSDYYSFLVRHGILTESYNNTTIIPDWTKHKEDILWSILWWPASLLWTLLNDPVVRLAKFIRSKLGNVYQQVANKVFKIVGVHPDDFVDINK